MNPRHVAVRQFVATRPDLVHIARPEEVAAIIAYLASEEAGLKREYHPVALSCPINDERRT
jgi:hypothetical protein